LGAKKQMMTENPQAIDLDDSNQSENRPATLRFAIWDRADVIEVDANQMVTLGRAVDGETVTVDLSKYHARLLGVSRRHAQVFPTPTGMAVRDLNSANGTSLNGTPLQSGKAYDLRHSDELQIGGLYVTVYFA
jgi:pSer/pThr/pTyr-binding forkhead associated (FHA) protein